MAWSKKHAALLLLLLVPLTACGKRIAFNGSAEEEEETTVAADNMECFFEITQANRDAATQYMVNRSPDKSLKFAVESAKVNGVTTELNWQDELTPGERVKASVDLSALNLTEHTDIDLSIHVYRVYEWDGEQDNIVQEIVRVPIEA